MLRSAYAAGWIWGVSLRSNVHVPSPIDRGWKYNEERKLVVDWCPVHLVNLNDYLFTCICKRSCAHCKCRRKEASRLPFCSCVYVATGQSTTG